ncbi:uncharacterized protein LOC135390614 [Ornithodoros turicata]|uniref:uncharacterized protein LOC135390614 n=1 Tax=Ornithodoros turicata TaxID=34597 RepID=UPI0031396663
MKSIVLTAILLTVFSTASSGRPRSRRAGILNFTSDKRAQLGLPVVPSQSVPIFFGKFVSFSGQVLPTPSAPKSKPNLAALVSTPKEVVGNISHSFGNAVGLIVDPVVSFLVNASDVFQRGVSDIKSTVKQTAVASVQDASELVKSLHAKKLSLLNKPVLPSAAVPIIILRPPLPMVPINVQSAGGVASGANILLNSGGGTVSSSQGNLIIGTLVSGPVLQDAVPGTFDAALSGDSTLDSERSTTKTYVTAEFATSGGLLPAGSTTTGNPVVPTGLGAASSNAADARPSA